MLKMQMEKLKMSNKQLKERMRKNTNGNSSRTERFRSVSRKMTNNNNNSYSKANSAEIRQLENVIERLKSDVTYHQMQKQDFALQIQNLQRNGDSRNLEKKFETEKSKNHFLDTENIRLQKQIRDLNMKYKACLDEKNRSTIDGFVSKRKVTVNSMREEEEKRGQIQDLHRENKNLKEKLHSMNNEIKMNKNISEAISSKESQMQQMKISLQQYQQQIQILQGKISNLEIKNNMMEQALTKKESDFINNKKGSDHLVQMYQKLYNDMKNECEIYMTKVEEMQKRIQSGEFNSNTQVFTKKVYQGL